MAPPAFVDISAVPALQPGAAHRRFCAAHGVAVALLHSHHGVSELLHYTDARTGRQLSRPATPADKAAALPCSFYVDGGGLVPFEWTADAATKPAPAPGALPALVADLTALSAATGLPLGFTLRTTAPGLVEVDVAGAPGCHAYLPREELALPPPGAPTTRELITYYGLGSGTTATDDDEVTAACVELVIYCTSSCGVHHTTSTHVSR